MHSAQNKQPAPDDKNRADQSQKSDNTPASSKVLHYIEDQMLLGHSADRKPFARTQDGKVMPIYSEEMKSILTYQYHKKYDLALSGTALKEALDTACSRALQEGDEWDIRIRCARNPEALEIDHVEERGLRIRILPDLVELIESKDGKHYFIQPPGALALPLPNFEAGAEAALSHLSLLERYINLQDTDDLILLVTWVAYSLYGQRGFPILALVGPAGSGKSETARMLRQLIDPNSLPLGSLPNSERDAFIEADSSRLLIYDNIQPVRKTELSDRLAKIATGGGIRPRQLYSDNATVPMFVCNPILTTSIEVPARRPDLVDRMLTVNLQRVPEDKRTPSKVLEQRYLEDAPKIFAGICVLISQVMVELQSLDADSIQLPRLADFGLFGIAAERVMGAAEGTFMQLYQKAVKESSQGVVEEEPLLEAVIAFMDKSKDRRLRLTPKMLSAKLAVQGLQHRLGKRDLDPRAVGRKMRMLVEDLDRHGITCTFGRDKDRYIELVKQSV